jgi:uncharacterized Tic20 family protein
MRVVEVSMLEILALWWLTKRIGTIVRQKGHESLAYQIIAVVLWFGGEIAGGIFGLIVGAFMNDSLGCLIYLFALVGAVGGGGFAYFIATRLSPSDPTMPTYPYGEGM